MSERQPAVLSFFLLPMLMLFLGCAQEEELYIDLPEVSNAPQMMDRDPRTLDVTVNERGEIRFRHRYITIDELRAQLADEKWRDVPVTIRAARKLPFSALEPVINAATKGNPLRTPKMHFSVRHRRDGLSKIGFYPILDDSSLTMVVRISRIGHETAINGAVLSQERIRAILSKLASISSEQSILLVPDEGDTLQDVVDWMNLCVEAKLEIMCIGGKNFRDALLKDGDGL